MDIEENINKRGMKMYRIFVCDDEAQMARHIAGCIREEFQKQQKQVTVEWYTEPILLERSVRQGDGCDVLFLDIDMPKLDGIELCRHFRQQGIDSLVIFVSNREELVFQTFEVSPFRFMRKNYFHSEIPGVCRDVLSELKKREEKYLRFENEKEHSVYAVNIQKLMYVEADRKWCRLCSTDGRKDIKITFSSLADKLKEFNFILIHRSYIVNPHYIYRIDNEAVILDDKTELPLSRNRRKQVKEEFFRWNRSGVGVEC